MVEAPDVRVIHLGNAKTLRQFAGKEHWHATSIIDTMRAHKIDKPMLLTFVFIATIGLALAAIPLLAMGYQSALLLPLVILFAPMLTAVYRVITGKNYRYVFHLLPLYFIVYVVRSWVIVRAVVTGAWREK